VLLLRIQLALGEVEPFWKQVHGQLQVFGFIVPLVLGFGTYLVPRIAGGRPIRAGLALPSLLALGGAAVLAVVALFGGGTEGVRRALAVLVAVGTVVGAICLEASLRGARRGHERLLQASIVFLALSGLSDAAAWWLSSEGDLAAGFAAAAWRLGVEGFAIGMALAVSARMFSGFLGIEPSMSFSPAARAGVARERVFGAASALWAASVAIGGVAAIVGSFRFERVADILFAAGAVPLAFQLGLARVKGGPAIDRTRDPLFPFGARASYALFAAAGLLGAAVAVADLADFRVNSLWFDARRHLLTIGFLLTLIATMAGRLAPGFAGRPLALPKLRAFAMAGFAVAAVARSLEGVAGQWGPDWLLWLSALSGTLAVAALLALAISVGGTLLTDRRTHT
jgi:hypothetical protein